MSPAVPGAGDPDLYLGLISGTSADGIDAALVRFGGDAATLQCELLLGRTYRWDGALRTHLVALGQGQEAASLDDLGTLD
ncbi:MAG: anhydro-N-acetylmuramic acid kinase, partial [Gammaproteobacteria bacterium]|nr:anhydro-N-acetylmuramic acid kinase [Gammaproteobacteria bacterium]